MRDSELVGLGEREAERLAGENDHCAATIVRELCRRLSEKAAVDAGVTIGCDVKSVERLAAIVAADRANFEKNVATAIAKSASRGPHV